MEYIPCGPWKADDSGFNDVGDKVDWILSPP